MRSKTSCRLSTSNTGRLPALSVACKKASRAARAGASSFSAAPASCSFKDRTTASMRSLSAVSPARSAASASASRQFNQNFDSRSTVYCSSAKTSGTKCFESSAFVRSSDASRASSMLLPMPRWPTMRWCWARLFGFSAAMSASTRSKTAFRATNAVTISASLSRAGL